MHRWYDNIRLRAGIVCATCVSVLTPPLAIAGEDGILKSVRSKFSQVKRTTEYNHVEQLARCLDQVEEELLEDGSVVAKAPDIWGEARLTRHRQEFERQLAAKLDDFQVSFNASVSRSDQAFLASAFLLSSNLTPTGGASTAAPITATQVNATLPALAIANPDGTIPSAAPANSMVVYPSQPGTLFGDNNQGRAGFGLEDDKIRLEPTIELDQLGRYLNHLHEIRRMNEGDDTSDSPGYSLNLVRIPVSILPGSKTRKGHGAEITVTAEPHVTDELLPTTFRQLVINDLVDQLSVPVYGAARPMAVRRDAMDRAYKNTKGLLSKLAAAAGQTYSGIDVRVTWFTREGFASIVEGLDGELSPEQVKSDLDLIDRLVQLTNSGEQISLQEADRAALTSIVDRLLRHFGLAFPEQYQHLIAVVSPETHEISGIPNDRSLAASHQGIADKIFSAYESGAMRSDAPDTFTLATDGSPISSDLLLPIWKQLCGMLSQNRNEAQELLRAYSSINESFSMVSSISAQRRARSPLSGQNLLNQLGRDTIEAMALQCIQVIDAESQSGASAMRGLLRDELESAYEAVFSEMALGRSDLSFLEDAVIRGQGVEEARNHVLNSINSGAASPYTLRGLLAWPIVAESLLLNRQLNADMRHVSQDPECDCMLGATGDLAFYGLDPGIEARKAFVQYVKCRWPIHVFALDPMAQEQNIADQYSMRREMQLAMALAFATGRTSAQNATRYIRRLEMDMETVALNRTAVAFGHGNDTFGWRFTPRVQTPDFESNATTAFRDLIGGGPNRDDLRKQWELEAGMKECVAIVLMPSFITHVRFDCRGHFYPLTCDHLGIKTPSDARSSVYDNVELSRMIRQMQDCAQCAFNESHLYRDGEVDRLLRRVSQVEKRLPLQTNHSRVPNENTLGGFEMFSSGVTDLAPELYDFYGEPGFKPGNETRLFLVGNNFSVTGTRVIAGNREVKYDLLSREVMEVVIPADAVREDGIEEKDFIDVHVATPYGVSPHVHIPVIDSDGAGLTGFQWKSTAQDVKYRWKKLPPENKPNWTVDDAGIMLRRPHELLIDAPVNQRLLPGAAELEWTAAFADDSSHVRPDDVLVAGAKLGSVRFDAAAGNYVLDGTNLTSLHKAIKDGVVAKLQAQGQQGDPPLGGQEVITVIVSARIKPAGAPSDAAVASQLKLVIQFEQTK